MAFVCLSYLKTQTLARNLSNIFFLDSFLTQTLYTHLFHRLLTLLETTFFRLQTVLVFFLHSTHIAPFTPTLFSNFDLAQKQPFHASFSAKPTVIAPQYFLFQSPGRNLQHSLTFTLFSRSCPTANFCFSPIGHHYLQRWSLLLFAFLSTTFPSRFRAARTARTEHRCWDKSFALANWSSGGIYTLRFNTVYWSRKDRGHYSASVSVTLFLSFGSFTTSKKVWFFFLCCTCIPLSSLALLSDSSPFHT